MTTFDGRERGYENKFAHDQETEFKILARKSYLLGLWAAEKMKLAKDAAENYANALVDKVVSPKPDFCIKTHVHSELAEKGIAISAEEVGKEAERLHQTAKDQIINIG